MMHWRSSLYKTTAKCGNGLLYWKDAGFGSRRRYGDGRCRFIPASLPPASFPADGFHWQIWIIPRWNSEQCFREHDHQQLPDVGQLLVSYLQGLLLRIVYCGPALRAPPPPPFATHLFAHPRPHPLPPIYIFLMGFWNWSFLSDWAWPF